MDEDRTMAEKQPTFDEAMARLEEIVAEIEAGQIPLEQAIERYAEGQRLRKLCQAILDQAEQKIQLLGKEEGEMLEVSGELPEADEA